MESSSYAPLVPITPSQHCLRFVQRYYYLLQHDPSRARCCYRESSLVFRIDRNIPQTPSIATGTEALLLITRFTETESNTIIPLNLSLFNAGAVVVFGYMKPLNSVSWRRFKQSFIISLAPQFFMCDVLVLDDNLPQPYPTEPFVLDAPFAHPPLQGAPSQHRAPFGQAQVSHHSYEEEARENADLESLEHYFRRAVGFRNESHFMDKTTNGEAPSKVQSALPRNSLQQALFGQPPQRQAPLAHPPLQRPPLAHPPPGQAQVSHHLCEEEARGYADLASLERYFRRSVGEAPSEEQSALPRALFAQPSLQQAPLAHPSLHRAPLAHPAMGQAQVSHHAFEEEARENADLASLEHYFRRAHGEAPSEEQSALPRNLPLQRDPLAHPLLHQAPLAHPALGQAQVSHHVSEEEAREIANLWSLEGNGNADNFKHLDQMIESFFEEETSQGEPSKPTYAGMLSVPEQEYALLPIIQQVQQSADEKFFVEGEIPTVYVSNLPSNMTDMDILKVFRRFGRIERKDIFLKNPEVLGTGFSDAFVFFEDIESANNAIQASPLYLFRREVAIRKSTIECLKLLHSLTHSFLNMILVSALIYCGFGKTLNSKGKRLGVGVFSINSRAELKQIKSSLSFFLS